MNSMLEMFPILVFAGAYYLADIFVATAAAIAASVVQVAWFWLRDGRVKTSHLVTLAVIILFGGMTLAFQDESFIKWKFTVVSWLFAAVVFGSRFVGERTLVERMMGGSFTVPGFVWLRANAAIGILLLAEGAINVYVMYNFDTDTWFNVKLYGMSAATLLFMLGLGYYLARYVNAEAEAETVSSTEEK